MIFRECKRYPKKIEIQQRASKKRNINRAGLAQTFYRKRSPIGLKNSPS